MICQKRYNTSFPCIESLTGIASQKHSTEAIWRSEAVENLGHYTQKYNKHPIYILEEMNAKRSWQGAKRASCSASNEKDQRKLNKMPEVAHAKTRLKNTN